LKERITFLWSWT